MNVWEIEAKIAEAEELIAIIQRAEGAPQRLTEIFHELQAERACLDTAQFLRVIAVGLKLGDMAGIKDPLGEMQKAVEAAKERMARDN